MGTLDGGRTGRPTEGERERGGREREREREERGGGRERKTSVGSQTFLLYARIKSASSTHDSGGDQKTQPNEVQWKRERGEYEPVKKKMRERRTSRKTKMNLWAAFRDLLHPRDH